MRGGLNFVDSADIRIIWLETENIRIRSKIIMTKSSMTNSDDNLPISGEWIPGRVACEGARKQAVEINLRVHILSSNLILLLQILARPHI
jgi:hypothetical protein